MDARQDVNDDTVSRERTLGFQEVANGIVARAKQAEGVDAGAARKEAEESLRKAEREAMAGLNPRAARYTEGRIAAYRVPYLDEIDRHPLAQTKTAADATYTAQIDRSLEEAAKRWDRPDEFRSFVDTGKAVIRDRNALHGRHEGDPTLDDELAEFESRAVTKVVGLLVAEGDYDGALTFHAANEDRLTVGDATALAISLRSVREGRQAISDVEGLLGQGVPAAAVVPSGGKFTAPVKGGTVVPGGAYGVARGGGKRHNGIDFAVPEGTPVTPIGGGVVVAVSSDHARASSSSSITATD
jgi:murein DD-endopeptidase MepM/ murein hydrolase activator NlpD